jgi:hypothetical protein
MPSKVKARKVKPRTQEQELAELLAEWQQRLRLQDWVITLELSDTLEDYGICETCIPLKEATITMRTPDTIPEDWLGCQDPEVTLCHEALCVFTAGFEGDLKKSQRNSSENMVELTAQALVAAKRGLLLMHPYKLKLRGGGSCGS